MFFAILLGVVAMSQSVLEMSAGAMTSKAAAVCACCAKHANCGGMTCCARPADNQAPSAPILPPAKLANDFQSLAMPAVLAVIQPELTADKSAVAFSVTSYGKALPIFQRDCCYLI